MLKIFIRKCVIWGVILLLLGVSFSSNISGDIKREDLELIPTSIAFRDYTLAYWKFNEGSGNTLGDSTGHGFDGTVYGASWAEGHSGGALDFDGVNDYVDLDVHAEDLGHNKSDDVIWSLWFKSQSGSDGLLYSTSDKWGVSNPELSFQLCANGSIMFKLWTNYCGIVLYSIGSYNDDKWHNLEVTFNGVSANPTVEIFVDGNFDNNITEWLCPILSDEFAMNKIGRRAYDATSHFDGLIDEFKIIKYPGGNKQESPNVEGPIVGQPFVEYEFTFTLSDPEDDDIELKVDWGDGDVTDWLGPYTSGKVVTLSHIWDEEDIFCVRAKTRDYWHESHWSSCHDIRIGNQRPDPPLITGPKHGDPQVEYTYNFTADDYEGEDVRYFIDWDDGDTTEIGYHSSGEMVTASHSWNSNGDYNISARAYDINNKEGFLAVYHIRIGDKQPSKPDIYGAVHGYPDIEYEYGFIATDPEGDDLTYEIDWGDGSVETDIGPFASGEIFPRSHMWNKTGNFVVRSRVKDEFDFYSEWSDHEISVPRNKLFNFNLFQQLFDRFPGAFLLLRYLVGLLKNDTMLLENLNVLREV